MTLHPDETPIDPQLAKTLVAQQFPQWAGLELGPAGAGTDNVMYRLGDDLLLRLPRTPFTAKALHKEVTWLPRLAPALPLQVPAPVAVGEPNAGYPHPWAVYSWIPGESADLAEIADQAEFGRSLARFVLALRQADHAGARRCDGFDFYRSLPFRDRPAWAERVVTDCRALPAAADTLDLDAAAAVLAAADALPAVGSDGPAQLWLHSDLRPANLLVHGGELTAVIDWGALSLGDGTAEHAPVWDLSAAARAGYRDELRAADDVWLRAAGWSLIIGLSGVLHYHRSWPAFADESRARVRAVLADPSVTALA